MIKVAVCGANGKMGQEVVKAVNSANDMELVAKIDIINGEFESIKEAKEAQVIDVLIDFPYDSGKFSIEIIANGFWYAKSDKYVYSFSF